MLLGWVQDRVPVDAGVPPEVASIIARAACSSYVLTFFDRQAAEYAAPSKWTTTPWGWACVVDPPIWKRVLGRWALPLVATSVPTMAAQLFYADYFSWELRGQIVLLSTPGVAPPPLTYEQLEWLVGDEPLDRRAVPLPQDFVAVIVPGPDGDFAEFIAFEEAVRGNLTEEIRRECNDAGVAWSLVPEDEFLQTKWFRDRAGDLGA